MVCLAGLNTVQTPQCFLFTFVKLIRDVGRTVFAKVAKVPYSLSIHVSKYKFEGKTLISESVECILNTLDFLLLQVTL